MTIDVLEAKAGARRQALTRILNRVQSAIDPATLLRPHLKSLNERRNYIVVGAGKAAAAMARACEKALSNVTGAVVAPYGLGGDSSRIKILEASHPLPDQSSVNAAEEIVNICRTARPDDEILFLVSGGASSLMALPALGVTLNDKIELTAHLLRSGADIHEINIVRKHLSRVKGGRLSAITKTDMRTFALSDVPGDIPESIGSGPTIPDRSTLEDARAVLRRWRIQPSAGILAALTDPANETPKAHPCAFRREFISLGGPSTAIEAGSKAVKAEGYEPIVLGIQSGEARDVAESHFRLAASLAKQRGRFALVSGGELSVSLGSGAALGGRCREYSLAICSAAGRNSYWISGAAWDTDGIDGTGKDAGAFFFSDSYERAERAKIDPHTFLNEHRSGEFFRFLGDQIGLGPTGTNVGDFRVILVDPA